MSAMRSAIKTGSLAAFVAAFAEAQGESAAEGTK